MRATSRPHALSPEAAAAVFQDLHITAETLQQESQQDASAWGALTRDLITEVADHMDLPLTPEAPAAFRRWHPRARPGNLMCFLLHPEVTIFFVKVSDTPPAVWFFMGSGAPEKLSVDDVARRLTAVTAAYRTAHPWPELAFLDPQPEGEQAAPRAPEEKEVMAIGAKGMQVQIFQKPLTAEDPEGIATLVKLIEVEEVDADGSSLERWQVRFPGDRRSYRRRICFRHVTL